MHLYILGVQATLFSLIQAGLAEQSEHLSKIWVSQSGSFKNAPIQKNPKETTSHVYLLSKTPCFIFPESIKKMYKGFYDSLDFYKSPLEGRKPTDYPRKQKFYTKKELSKALAN